MNSDDPFDMINHNTTDDEKCGPLTAEAFERFINQQYDNEQLKHIVADQPLRAQAQDLIERAKGSLGVRTAFMLPSISISEYGNHMEQTFREHIQRAYGEAFVTEADEFARTHSIGFVHAVDFLQTINALDRTAEAARAAFEGLRTWITSPEVQAKINEINAALQDAARQLKERQLFGQSEPINRRERRAAKHNKPMKDADQQWKRRDYHNRRKH